MAVSRNRSEIPQFITRKAAAETLAVTVQTIDKILRQGELSAYRIGRCVRLRRDELLAYLERQRG